ncbi:hypothetical protein UT300007_12620 [Clostridium sp. CTA-7]
MITIYTIGFTKKSAERFFELLEENNVETVFDVRLNNSTQLAGFSKGKDMEFFLRRILSINYIHNIEFSPTKEILDDYKKKKISWENYEEKFGKLLKARKLESYIKNNLKDKLDKICFLCSEDTAEHCHRRLVAEYIKDILKDEDIEIVHI